MSSDKKLEELSNCKIEIIDTKENVTEEEASKMWGPLATDQAIRSAVTMCWMMLPADRKNADAVESELRRLLDRAIANLREDAKAFGIQGSGRTKADGGHCFNPIRSAAPVDLHVERPNKPPGF